MFQSARLTLTAWYLLIIMIITAFFSIALYRAGTQEIQRLIRMQQIRQERENGDSYTRIRLGPTVEDLEETARRLQVALLLVNGCILVLAGGAAYFLAGRTLLPIKEMVDEQGRFITDSSHELRTPLTALRAEMEAALLEKNMTAKDAKKLIASNLEEVINLQSLSDNLLTLTQYSNKNNTGSTWQAIPFLEIPEDALKKITPLAKKKHITIRHEGVDVSIQGDLHTLSKLFVILLENAIKYSPKDSVIAITSEKTDHILRVSIKDQGVGIDEKDLPHIFDRFYRADKSRTKTDVAGYGLGLSIAKTIVETYKGSISVKSKNEKGSTFTVQLPIEQG